MMGRIGDVVREQAGLAYYASSSLGGGGPGRGAIGRCGTGVQVSGDLHQEEIARS